MTTEAALMRRIMVRATKLGWRLFRNNVGMAWMGRTELLDNGDVLVRNAKPVRFGIGGEGGSDLIGFRPYTVTEADVGRKVALFTAVEVKSDRGRLTAQQDCFLSFIKEYAGHSQVARDPADLV